MNKILHSTTTSSGALYLYFGAVIAALLAFSLIGIGSAHAAIVGQMDFGSTGSDVTQLQTYLSTRPNLYPSGLVTGYFGPLTQAGVEKLQAAEGIVSSGSPETTGYGRVGPITVIKLNNLLGFAVVPGDAVPILSVPQVQYSATTATITWTTNEATQGQIYYDTVLIQTDETSAPRQLPGASGTLASDANGFGTNHIVSLSNLQRNMTYYYIVRSIDSAGNMSMTWPSTSFHTSN